MQYYAVLKNKLKTAYEEFRVYNLGSLALNRVTPKKGYTVQYDLAYGEHERHRFDLYVTDQPRPKQPLLIFVHGGAWSSGDKKDYAFVGEAFAKEGFHVLIMNYSLAPKHIFPSYVDDLSLLLSNVEMHLAKYDIATDNLVLLGHSAGAFNIMSVLYSPYAYELNAKSKIKAVIGLAGPYHFDYKDDPLCADAFDQQVPYQQVMPYYFVQHNSIQHYLLVAENDTIVHENNAIDFDQALKQHNNHSEIIYVAKTGHITIMGSVASLFSRFYPTKQHIMQALNQVFN